MDRLTDKELPIKSNRDSISLYLLEETPYTVHISWRANIHAHMQQDNVVVVNITEDAFGGTFKGRLSSKS